MRRLLVVFLVLLIPAAFVIGRETKPSTTRTPTPPLGTSTPILEWRMREGDVARVPTAATRCEASQEGGIPNLFCRRDPEGGFQVVFYKDNVLVFRVGDPDNPSVFPWKP
jgi:hypothetical protein